MSRYETGPGAPAAADAPAAASPDDLALRRRAIRWFLGLVFLIELPFYVLAVAEPGHLDGRWNRATGPLTMVPPALAAFIVLRWIWRPDSIRRFAGLRLGRAWPRYWLVALFGVTALTVAAWGIGWGLGSLPADPTHAPGFPALASHLPGLASFVAANPRTGLVLMAVLSLFTIPVAAVFLFGEELGWRGFLTPALLPWGQWRALVITGAVWGAWHWPAILYGSNYPGHPLLGQLFMVGFCVMLSILFGWLRLASGSLWPPLIAHGAVNAGGLVVELLGPRTWNPLLFGVVGLTGWILPVAFILWLVLTRRLPVPDPQ